MSRIAVIGMAGRFPGAPDVEALWQVLAEGRETLTVFSEEELREAGAVAVFESLDDLRERLDETPLRVK